MATPTPAHSDPAHDSRWQPPSLDPYPTEPQPVAPATYTATDSGAGVTRDSLQAWQSRRSEFGTFLRADVADVVGSAGLSYSGQPGAALVAPSLVLTDDAGRRLALNGTPCGFDGEGPRAAARILIEEGLMTEQAALPAVMSQRQLTVHRPATTPAPGVLPDAIALDPAQLQLWSAQQRWHQACSAIDPRLPTDPHYPALAAALDRVDAAGVDVQAALTLAAADGRLPDTSPGRALHFRLTATCDAAVIPAPPPAPGGPPPAAPPDRPIPGRSAPAPTGPRL